jgi:hypothetical protein
MNTIHFDVWPKIVPAGQIAAINIRPLYEHCSFRDRAGLAVQCVRDDGGLGDGRIAGWAQFDTVAFEHVEGSLVVNHLFDGEHEFAFRVVDKVGDQEKVLGVFRVYALAPDLFRLRPFKGDFHIHSNRSDGLEAPTYVAASGRLIGLDFMALTDHHQYQPSLEVMAAMRALPTDLRCYPGEEVHPPGSPVHMVNFGARFSVNALFAEGTPYRQEVDAAAAALSGISAARRYEVASSEWCFEKIREGGGIGIYCHPYWQPFERYYVCAEVNDALIQRQRFDALEIIGGFYRYQQESNALAIAHYQEARAEGKRIPVVGVSDAHGCDRDLFGWYYTVVFAPSVEFNDLADGIRDLRSVAVEAVPGEFPRVVGPFRLVKFAYFLLRDFYPLHDRLCAAEGQLLLDHLAGDPGAVARLAALQGQVPALWRKYWAGARPSTESPTSA